jgi:aromatic ring-opening dioxygenase catalytic subunit (LigB family)
MATTGRLPTLFIPHGGGPCFFMETPPQFPRDMWDGMAAYLKGLADAVGQRPEAVLVVSGHWDAERPTLNVADKPGLLVDYNGFPEHTYRLTYPVDGAPELAAQVRDLLAEAGFDSATEAERGLDHGVFVPFKLVYPDADVPVLQLSLLSSMDAQGHLALGRALAPLRDQGVLIVGSGMSYHNLRELFSGRGNEAAEAFDAWLDDAVSDAAARDRKLAAWASAPGARESHPQAEHLLPLLVAAGAAGSDPGVRTYHERLLGKPISAFQFG